LQLHEGGELSTRFLSQDTRASIRATRASQEAAQ